jgi:NAD(P)-dependent dehydrogenase (short-subunit alcohol dehydrogenase family)
MNILDQFRLTGKIALVTGASKGIGAAMAAAFAQAGAKVVVCSRKQEAVDEVAQALTAQGLEAIGIAANVGRGTDILMLTERVLQRYGRIDILVNNAAVNPVFGPLAQTDAAAFDKIMDVNLKGPFELAKAVYPHMAKNGGGSIINISSVEGLSPEKFMGIYSVSKAALIMLTKVMAKEWAADKVRVNAICPGLIQTKFSEALWNNQDILNMVLSRVPLARMGQSEEMAGLALFLASDAGSYCTGGVYTADGGYTV